MVGRTHLAPAGAGGGGTPPLTHEAYLNALDALIGALMPCPGPVPPVWPPQAVEALLRQWDEATGIHSSISAILNHPVPKTIEYDWGIAAIPHLIENLKHPQPYQSWGCFALLARLAPDVEVPEEIRGKYQQVRQFYIDWYHKIAPVEN